MSKEIIGYLFWFLFACYVAVASYHLDLGGWSAPDAGYVPFGAACLLGMISLWLLIKALAKGPLPRTKPGDRPEKINWRDLSLTFVGMFVYILLLKWLGFVLCTFLFMAFLIWVVGRSSCFASLIAASSITAVSYLLFEVLLEAQFPKGILEAFF